MGGKACWLGCVFCATEVTVAQYKKFRRGFAPDARFGGYVSGVSWYEAVEFCKWLSEKEDRPYRLPTTSGTGSEVSPNAMLLPDVLEFNLPVAPHRYARIALAMGCQEKATDILTAQRGIERIRHMCQRCGIPSCLSDFGIQEDDVPGMAESALTVTRLLKNHLRELTREDAEGIYRGLLRGS